MWKGSVFPGLGRLPVSRRLPALAAALGLYTEPETRSQPQLPAGSGQDGDNEQNHRLLTVGAACWLALRGKAREGEPEKDKGSEDR